MLGRARHPVPGNTAVSRGQRLIAFDLAASLLFGIAWGLLLSSWLVGLVAAGLLFVLLVCLQVTD